MTPIANVLEATPGFQWSFQNLYKMVRTQCGYSTLCTSDANWIWYATEFDGMDTFFGLVHGLEKELGYFSLSDLKAVRGPFGLPIERDLYWKPQTLREISPELFRELDKV